MKIKLTTNQLEKLKRAVIEEQQTQAAFRTAQAAAAKAANHKADLLDLLYESHGVDKSKLGNTVQLTPDGHMMAQEVSKLKKSDKIRKELKSADAIKANKKGKVVPLKTK